jgi:ATP-dependent Clp protease ATP-binding subunit ClpC
MPDTARLSGDVRVIVESSRRLAESASHETWSTMHVLAATLPFLQELLAALEIEPHALEGRLSKALAAQKHTSGPHAPLAGSRPAPEVEGFLDAAVASARERHTRDISAGQVLLSLAQRGDATAGLLRDAGLTPDRIAPAVYRLDALRDRRNDPLPPLPTPVARLGRDLTGLARRGELDPVVGREAETARVIALLSRRMKNSPVLIGEPGVGKTAIVEGLASRIADGRVPSAFHAQRVFALDLGLLVAGSSARGQFEDRLYAVIREAEDSERRLILFIDEVHMLVGAGASEGGFDAASILKPAIARGTLSLIGATTPDAYRRFIEKDSALERRFSPVWVTEPPASDAVRILHGVRERYETFHRIKFDDAALEAAVRLSVRYLTARALPDKAIDLIDEAAAAVGLRSNSGPATSNGLPPRVTEAEIAQVTATMTGIPLGRILQSERLQLLTIEQRIRRRFVGQERAVELVSEAIRRNRAGLRTSRGPIGAFLFLGPSGVGKTELARRLADAMFGSPEELLRLDMSEYMERHNVARLFGAPPGYVGYDDAGSLTERVRRRPYQVLLFDEIEKAHPDVLNALLQVLDAGRMTDNHGRAVDFRNTVVIMTSNLGTANSPGPTRADREAMAGEAIRVLPPEFRNRIDEVVVFEPLTRVQADRILGIYLEELRAALGTDEAGLRISRAAREALIAEGFDESTGARPLRGALERRVVSGLSRELLRSEWNPGDRLAVGYRSGKFSVKRTRVQVVHPHLDERTLLSVPSLPIVAPDKPLVQETSRLADDTQEPAPALASGAAKTAWLSVDESFI